MSTWSNLTVLDCTRLLPGAYATLYFADWGADVIKIERPGQGDYSREYEPTVSGKNPLFHATNRNKRSMTLNLKHDRGRELFLELAEDADVLVEGFRPGVMDRLELSYEHVREINPGIVYCSLTGYGQDGPKKLEAGHDVNYLSYAGIMGQTGPPECRPGLSGTQIADLGGALEVVVGVLKSLFERMMTGEGSYVDVSMYDTSVSLLSGHLINHLFDEGDSERGTSRLNGGVICYNIYRTADDRYLSLGALEPKFWQRFCELIEREDLLEERWAPAREGVEAYEELKQTIAARPLDEWTRLFEGEDVCAAPVLNMDEVFENEQFQARGMEIEVPAGPNGDTIPQIRLPIPQDEPETLDYEEFTAAPLRGEQTHEVLGELGLDEAEIEQLADEGVIEE